MKKEYLRIISEYLGVFPVNIESNLVSAQNRNRWYWSNIRTREQGLFNENYTDIPQPADRGLLLKDILQPENEVNDKYYLSKKAIQGIQAHKTRHAAKGNGFGFKETTENDKMRALKIGGSGMDDVICVTPNRANGPGEPTNEQNRTLYNGYVLRRLTPTECSRLQTVPAWYRWACSDTQAYRMLGNGWTIEVIKHIFKYL